MLKSEDRTRNSSGSGEQTLAGVGQGSRSEVSGSLGRECSVWGWMGQANRTCVEGSGEGFVARQDGFLSVGKGKLTRGEWADSCCGVMSLGSSSWLRQRLSGRQLSQPRVSKPPA